MRGRRQQTKRRLKSEFVFFFSVFITIIPTHWLCQMWANSSVAEFLHCEKATQVRLRVYLGVKTCEVFLCFQAIIFLGSIALSSQWLLCIHCFTSLVSFRGFYTEGEFRKRKKISSWFIYVLHEMQNLAFSRRSRAIQKRCGARAMFLFCFAFLTFLSPSPCLVPVRRLQPRPSA